MTLPGAYTMQYLYDDLGNVTRATDTNGDYTDYTYDLDNRKLTEVQPNGLRTTWVYTEWKTRSLSSVLQERNTTSGDDITTSYNYDANGRQLTR
jgi:YD repeat-containing protein